MGKYGIAWVNMVVKGKLLSNSGFARNFVVSSKVYPVCSESAEAVIAKNFRIHDMFRITQSCVG